MHRYLVRVPRSESRSPHLVGKAKSVCAATIPCAKCGLVVTVSLDYRSISSSSKFCRPISVFKAASRLSGNMSFGIMDLFPHKEIIDSMLSAFPTEPADASIALRSPLLPLSGLEDSPSATEEIFDLDGYSSYARIISLLLDVFLGDRIFAKAHPWALRHFVALSVYAEEVMDLPNSSCGVFDAKVVSTSTLQHLVQKVQQVTTYVLSDAGDEQRWHQQVTVLCMDQKLQHDVGEVGKFVASMLGSATLSDNPRDARILHTILQHILNHTSKEEGEMWMGVCRKFETKGKQVSYPLSLWHSRFVGSSICLDGRSSICR